MSAAAPPPADDAGWVRVHPASPWIKGWSLVAVFLFVALRDTGERLVGSLLGGGDAAGEPFEMQALLIGIVSELRITNILTTEVSAHAAGVIREVDRARRVMYAAREAAEELAIAVDPADLRLAAVVHRTHALAAARLSA